MPAVVFGLGVVASLTAAQHYERSLHGKALADDIDKAEIHRRALDRSLSAFVAFSQGLAAHVATSEMLDRDAFEKYVEIAEAMHAYPGLGMVGFAARVPRDGVAEFERTVRTDYPGFQVRSYDDAVPGAADVLVLLHLYPPGGVAAKARGMDQYAIPERRAAMRAAAVSGQVTVTALHRSPILGTQVQATVAPVYAPAVPGATPEQRLAALRGGVFALFRIEDVVQAVLGPELQDGLDLRIYDRSDGGYRLLYGTDGPPNASPEPHGEAISRGRVAFADRDWEVAFFSHRNHETGRGAVVLAAVGVALSGVLAWWLWRVERARRRNQANMGFAAGLHRTFRNHPSAVFYLDRERRFVNANDKALAEFGLRREQLIGTVSGDLIAPEFRDDANKHWQHAVGDGTPAAYDTVLIAADGRRFDARVVLVPIAAGSEVAGVLGVAENITEHKQRDAELRESRRMLQSIIDHLPQFVFWKDAGLRFLGANRRFAEYIGVGSADALVGRTDAELAREGGVVDDAAIGRYEAEDRQVLCSGEPVMGSEMEVQGSDGRLFWARTSKVPLFDSDGVVSGVLGVSEDITERKRFELQLQDMAHHDALTGLPNRAYLFELLEHALRRSARHGGHVAVAYFDIDRFKTINDTWGHEVGDRILEVFAARTRGAVRESDVVGRMGGDEFVMVSEAPAFQADMDVVARRLVEVVREPIVIRDDLTLAISTSIGIAFHRPGLAAGALLALADQAMYAAKQAGRNRIAYA